MLNLKVPMSGERWRENRHLAIERFRQGRHFLFSAYPDADALGTMLALGLYLRLLGKKATLFFPSPLKANLQFMKDIIQYNNIAVAGPDASPVDFHPGIRGESQEDDPAFRPLVDDICQSRVLSHNIPL